MCACGQEVETTEHFLLCCQTYSKSRSELFENLKKLEPNFMNFSANEKVQFLLYGSQLKNSESISQEILKFVIIYIKATGRFDKPLFNITQ